jgi:hypothetical protein
MLKNSFDVIDEFNLAELSKETAITTLKISLQSIQDVLNDEEFWNNFEEGE